MNALIPNLFNQDAPTFTAAVMPVSTTPYVLEQVTSLLGGDPATDLDAVPTRTKAVTNKPYFIRLNGAFRAVYLVAGAADPDDATEIEPTDYDADENSKHWELS
jgi:hypothetical protein